MTNDPDPQSKESGKPPRHHWNATEPFFDLRLSHWIQGLLALALLALLAVAIVQATVYFIQAGIMEKQLTEMRGTSADLRDSIEASNRFAKAAEDYAGEAKRLADAAAQSKDIANSTLQDSREALERNQRAWIGPVDAEIGPDDIPLIARPAKIPLRVIYQNTGREPALDVTPSAIGGAVPVPPGFSDWDHLEIPENKTCEGLSPIRGNIAAYPSTTSSPNNDIRFTGIVKDGGNAVNEVTNGNQILWINGCIAYRTIETLHQSAFCFYLIPDLTKPFAKWRFNGCRTGNWAN